MGLIVPLAQAEEGDRASRLPSLTGKVHKLDRQRLEWLEGRQGANLSASNAAAVTFDCI